MFNLFIALAGFFRSFYRPIYSSEGHHA